jgi:hypothetical protein
MCPAVQMGSLQPHITTNEKQMLFRQEASTLHALEGVGPCPPARPSEHYQPITGDPSHLSQLPRLLLRNEPRCAGEGALGRLARG